MGRGLWRGMERAAALGSVKREAAEDGDRKVIDTGARNADYRRPMSWMNLLDSTATASSTDARRHYQKPALARDFRRWCSPLGNLSADSANNHNFAF
jgi:hypothetical protein